MVLVFFDVGDMSSFERVKHWVDAAIESCLSHACSRTTVVLVVGHKADLATTGLSGGGVATSAKTGMGVEEAVATAVDMHRRELRAHEPPMKPGWWRPGVGPEPEPSPSLIPAVWCSELARE